MFYPLTASPFKKDSQYTELFPCAKLQPYIRCFWGSEQATGNAPGLVIPDVCADLIFRIWPDKVSASFVGVSDEPFLGSYTYPNCSTFAVRFYAWTVSLFSSADFTGTKNGVYHAEYLFDVLTKKISSRLFNVVGLNEKKRVAEEVLLEYFCLQPKHITMLEAVSEIIAKQGAKPIHEIAASCHLGSRQLERIFLSYTGLSPKKLSSLIRYQCVWSSLMQEKNLSLAERSAVFGYSDQAHLCREFKKYHGMTIDEAKDYAYKHVAFFQDRKIEK